MQWCVLIRVKHQLPPIIPTNTHTAPPDDALLHHDARPAHQRPRAPPLRGPRGQPAPAPGSVSYL